MNINKYYLNISSTMKACAIVSVIALSQIVSSPVVFASSQVTSNYTETQFSEAELAQLLAPIALYPDSLLSHLVIASTYPLEVVQAHRWQEQNSNLSASDAVEAAQEQGWDPSVAALVAFPTVLDRLNDDLQWTENVGNAFLEDEASVLDTIQTLRHQAEQVNTLKNMSNMKVTKVQQQIVIEPIQQEIIYVPYYDTRVVYGEWRWRKHPPIYWDHGHSYAGVHIGGRRSAISAQFSWHPGIHIRFDYFFSAFNWHSRHVVVTHHRKTRDYRSYRRLTSNHVAKRWVHQPSHRRGVAYRSNKLKSHYGARRYAKSPSQNDRPRLNKHRHKSTLSALKNRKPSTWTDTSKVRHDNSRNRASYQRKDVASRPTSKHVQPSNKQLVRTAPQRTTPQRTTQQRKTQQRTAQSRLEQKVQQKERKVVKHSSMKNTKQRVQRQAQKEIKKRVREKRREK